MLALFHLITPPYVLEPYVTLFLLHLYTYFPVAYTFTFPPIFPYDLCNIYFSHISPCLVVPALWRLPAQLYLWYRTRETKICKHSKISNFFLTKGIAYLRVSFHLYIRTSYFTLCIRNQVSSFIPNGEIFGRVDGRGNCTK